MFNSSTQIAVMRAAGWMFWLALPVVMLLATMPLASPAGLQQADKLQHAACFLLLPWLYQIGYPRRGADARVLIALLGLGVAIEAIQYFLPWRSSSGFDLLADLSGLLLFMLSRRLLRPWMPVCASD